MTTILWLHGFPLSSAVFEPQRAIAARHVMPDLPGFGTEPPPAPTCTIDDYARFAVGQLDRAGVQQAVLAGLSMGGYVALSVLRLAPERVSGLILIDTRETADSEDARRGRFESIETVNRDGVAPVVESMLPKMLTADAPPDMRESVRRLMMSSTSKGAAAALHAMATRADSSALLPRIAVPALVIAGEDDRVTPPADAERMAAAIPRSTLVLIPGAAHLSNVEQPTILNGAVERWLERHSMD